MKANSFLGQKASAGLLGAHASAITAYALTLTKASEDLRNVAHNSLMAMAEETGGEGDGALAEHQGFGALGIPEQRLKRPEEKGCGSGALTGGAREPGGSAAVSSFNPCCISLPSRKPLLGLSHWLSGQRCVLHRSPS